MNLPRGIVIYSIIGAIVVMLLMAAKIASYPAKLSEPRLISDHDGIKVYCVEDHGRPVYYADARATVLTTDRALVPITDGKSYDFSSGKAVVKDDPTLKDAEREMNEAAKDVTFPPDPKRK